MATSTARLANGTLLKIAAGSPTNFLTIGNAKTFNVMTGTNPEIQVTNLSSDAQEFLIGLADNGTVTFAVDTDFGDDGQAAAIAAKEARTRCDFQVVLPSGMTPTIQFQGFVKKFDVSGGVDQVNASSIEIRVTGPVTRS